MPVYSQTQSKVQQLIPGLPGYCWGSFDRDSAPTRMKVTSVALAGTTATVGVLVIEGNIPVIGQLVTINGAAPAYFNVTNAKITSVSAAAVPDVGVFTIQFTLANSNIGTTASTGEAVAPVAQVSEAVVAGASRAFGLQSNVNPAQGRAVRADVSFPVSAGSVTVTLQSASVDLDAEYTDLASVATLTGGVLTGGSIIVDGVTANFLRLNNTGLAGVSTTTVIGKILV